MRLQKTAYKYRRDLNIELWDTALFFRSWGYKKEPEKETKNK